MTKKQTCFFFLSIQRYSSEYLTSGSVFFDSTEMKGGQERGSPKASRRFTSDSSIRGDLERDPDPFGQGFWRGVDGTYGTRVWKITMLLMGKPPFLMENHWLTMENHHAFNGKINYFYVSFSMQTVSLPEGIYCSILLSGFTCTREAFGKKPIVLNTDLLVTVSGWQQGSIPSPSHLRGGGGCHYCWHLLCRCSPLTGGRRAGFWPGLYTSLDAYQASNFFWITLSHGSPPEVPPNWHVISYI